ncbi:unnamed protein product [Strongylus vulgaris]|uniref:Uncharacterized protein n=1 Tax=Strongylus vulgaris TaxID=40348 RepID=A0A3P7IP16_STRVU|nr:unnamed protein product [Strongylus vulgaris]
MSSRPISSCTGRHGFRQKDTSTIPLEDYHMPCTYNARTVSTKAHFHVLLEAAGRIYYHLIVMQKTKSRKTDVIQLSDGTLIIRESFVVVHPSVVYLVASHEIPSPHLAILRLRPLN